MSKACSSGSRLLLLAPSVGFGGGIERVADAIERSWPGSCVRVDLYRYGWIESAQGSPYAKGRFVIRAMREAARQRPDVVLALHVGLLPVAVGVASIVRARCALFGIGREIWGPLGPAVRLMIRRCSKLAAISTFTALIMARRSGVPLERITVVPLAIDESFLRVARARAGVRQRGPALITVSRIMAEERYKGHWSIAESLAAVLRDQPAARWIVVGDGNDVGALRARCEVLGIADAVQFEGRVSDARLAELYGESTALVLPSVADADARPPTGEGFGLVYGEAGAFGLPSIASTASGGAAELVIDGETGLTVPPGKPEALAAAMTRLVSDPALCSRLGEAARARVLSRHTPEAFGTALEYALGDR